MPDWAIDAKQVSKLYRRGVAGASTLTEEVGRWLVREPNAPRPERGSFYALKDVSFTVPRGAVCGLIGPNGSGKTTLMKVLASITEPTEGEILLRGRVGSLLEVGAGFDLNLDGIENIFLNGAILGMSRAEIRRKLDQIIAFADVGPMLETPVKRYSSGMYIRLAFAVAAHLEAEILLVDEVLAVGDAEFQRKCINTMREAARQGRTVILVSHDMAAINRVCDMGLYLEAGIVRDYGDLASVTETYMNRVSLHHEMAIQAVGGVSAEILFLDDAGKACSQLEFGRNYDLVIQLRTDRPLKRLAVNVMIHGEDGALLSTLATIQEGLDPFDVDGACAIAFKLRPLSLLPGAYYVGFSLQRMDDERPFLASEALRTFDVVQARVNGAAETYAPRHGLVRMSAAVEVRPL